MEIILRDYQQKAADAAVNFLIQRGYGGGLLVLPTGSGKSVVIADIARRIKSPLLIFCPSKEILEQNYGKMEKVAKGCSTMYSASVGQKKISMITFATIGSVNNHPEDFDVFRHILVDESHLVNAKGGMYERFIHRRPDRRVIGLTATPYRLGRGVDGASILKFLTRTKPRIFQKLLYYCQISDLLSRGYLAELRYFDLSGQVSFDINRVLTNSTGAEYDDESLQMEIERSGFAQDLFNWTMRVLHPKSGTPRSGVLVFTRFVRESEILVQKLAEKGIKAAIVTGETPKREREKIIKAFKSGDIQVVSNAQTMTTGFDYPELDTIIMARPTKSLSLWYQCVGRAIRPYPNKVGWILDLCSNYKRFGAVADLKIGLEKPNSERWAIFSKGRQLTNVMY